MDLQQLIEWLAAARELFQDNDSVKLINDIYLLIENSIVTEETALYMKLKSVTDTYNDSKRLPPVTKYLPITIKNNEPLYNYLLQSNIFTLAEIKALNQIAYQEDAAVSKLKRNLRVTGLTPINFLKELQDKFAELALLPDNLTQLPGQVTAREIQKALSQDQSLGSELVRILASEESKKEFFARLKKAEKDFADLHNPERKKLKERLTKIRELIDPEIVKEYVNLINKALKTRNIKDVMYQSYCFSRYIQEAINNKIPNLNLETLTELISEVFKNIFADVHLENAKLLVAINEQNRQILLEKQQEFEEKRREDPEVRHKENAYLNVDAGLNIFWKLVDPEASKCDYQFDREEGSEFITYKQKTNSLAQDHDPLTIRYILNTTPINQVEAKITEVFPNNTNTAKQKMHYVQIEHITEIYNAQLNIFTAQRQPAERNADLAGQRRQPEVKAVAYYFLKHIQETILSTDWEQNSISKFFGHKIYDQNDNFINNVPTNMVSILKVISKAHGDNPDGKNHEIWRKAYLDVARIGFNASVHKPISFFGIGKRSEKTQVFYDKFKKSYSNLRRFRSE